MASSTHTKPLRIPMIIFIKQGYLLCLIMKIKVILDKYLIHDSVWKTSIMVGPDVPRKYKICLIKNNNEKYIYIYIFFNKTMHLGLLHNYYHHWRWKNASLCHLTEFIYRYLWALRAVTRNWGDCLCQPLPGKI